MNSLKVGPIILLLVIAFITGSFVVKSAVAISRAPSHFVPEVHGTMLEKQFNAALNNRPAYGIACIKNSGVMICEQLAETPKNTFLEKVGAAIQTALKSFLSFG